MEIRQFMKRIGLPEEGQLCVLGFKMAEKEYEDFRRLFYQDERNFFRIVDEQPKKERMLLYLYVRFGAELHEKYAEKGISDEIYYDTFSDLTIWFSHCVREKHVIGLTEERWLKLHLKMKLFRLGRLQFETDEEKKRIHIHIPEGKPLSPDACDEAFLRAEEFFDASYEAFDCESWLLSPVLLELLDEKNRIVQFQKRFQIQKVDQEIHQAEERVFGEVRKDKGAYPEDTSLQRALKQYVMAGKNPGVGFGVIARSRKN